MRATAIAAPFAAMVAIATARAPLGAQDAALARSTDMLRRAPVLPVSTGAARTNDARLLELLGAGPGRPVSLADGDALPARAAARCRPVMAPSSLVTVLNSTRPHSEDDGPVWAGRGATAVAEGGVTLRCSAISLSIRPVAFVAQNADFSGVGSALSLGNPYHPNTIDAPRRPGDGMQSRVDPGESWLRADIGPLGAGLSTAAQRWGPALRFPLLMGGNAGGFPHAFVAADRLPIGIGHATARLVVGRLVPSGFEPPHAGNRNRIGTGVVGVWQPAGTRGVEIGASRFVHERYPDEGVSLRDLRRPFEGIFNTEPDSPLSAGFGTNQLASIFFRAVAPRSGVELYGEMLREDAGASVRDLLTQPDHSAAFLLGLRRAWRSGDGTAVHALGIELVNAALTHLARVRSAGAFYTHNGVTEGHTQRGQLLGAPAVFGGGGGALTWTRTRAAERRTVALSWQRSAQNSEGGSYDGEAVGFHALELERVRRTARGDIGLGVRPQLAWSGPSPFNLSVFASFSAP